MGNYYVYCHITPCGKKYVGISKNPVRRWNSGKGYVKNYLFYQAIKEYGWENIEHIILHSDLDVDNAKRIEIDLIDKWKLTDYNYGYNLRHGGDGCFSEKSLQLMSASRKHNTNCVGNVLSDSTRTKISESLKKYYHSHTPTFLGKKHSPETINKLRNRVITDETRQKMRENHPNVFGEANPSAKSIIQYDIDGNEINRFECAKYAADQYGIDLSSIIKCCRGKKKTCGGYKWAYAKNKNLLMEVVEHGGI